MEKSDRLKGVFALLFFTVFRQNCGAVSSYGGTLISGTQHNTNYLLYLYYQLQALQHFSMFQALCHYVDARSFYAGMTKNIGKLGDILFKGIETSGEKLS